MNKTKINRVGEENTNHQGCLMKIIKYNKASDICVQFQDDYSAEVHTDYRHFKNGEVKNPYYPTVHCFGIIGNKYPHTINKKMIKEYCVWQNMLARCFSEKEKQKYPTYKDVTCCDEWLLYDNFYEWLHSQDNFDKWLNGDKWNLDKDILIKGNKVYSPETCCLVPQSINILFTKNDSIRGILPIGVQIHGKKFRVTCNNPFTRKQELLGSYFSLEQSFQVYKEYKENIIKQVAQDEYNKNNITKQCYDAMMNYEVEITD